MFTLICLHSLENNRISIKLNFKWPSECSEAVKIKIITIIKVLAFINATRAFIMLYNIQIIWKKDYFYESINDNLQI